MALLKQELGFKGYVMTDWNAQHTTVEAANSGLDMTMPGSDYNGGTILWGPKLTSAVSGGQVAQSRVDDMVRRILAAWYLLGQDSGYPSVNLGASVQGTHKTNIRATARDGIVLLKNDGGILPLKKPAKLALVGSAAVANPKGINSCTDMGCNSGALGMGWGSGTAPYAYFSAPADAITTRAKAAGTQVTLQASDSTSNLGSGVSGADVAVVFITSDSGEGYITVEGVAGDRNNLDPWHNGNDLVKAVAAVNKNVVVVVHSVGPVLLETILAQPNVKAIVWAGLPSQESGNALVDVLYGDVSPSGKLPYTIAKAAADYGTTISGGDSSFSEGLYIDYRHFDKAAIAPRYEFGYGLCTYQHPRLLLLSLFTSLHANPPRFSHLPSHLQTRKAQANAHPAYTNFTYTALKISGTPTSGPATGSTIPGGRADLWDPVATVTATVTNSGGVSGAEVAQLYVGFPASANAPPKQLRGFAKLGPLAAGAGGSASFSLLKRDLSVWDAGRQNWVTPAGEFTFYVGSSSRDVRLTGKLTVA